MGRWAQAKRRGGGSAVYTVALLVPLLTGEGDPQINWSVAGNQPDLAQIEHSPDGIGGWAIEDTIPWTSIPYNVANGGDFYRVIGLDAISQPVTLYSNTVQSG